MRESLACIIPTFFGLSGQAEERRKLYFKAAKHWKKAGLPIHTVEIHRKGTLPVLNEVSNLHAIETESAMFFKENAINLGAKFLIRQGFSKIVWIDADSYFLSNDWVDEISRLLDKHALIQCCDVVQRPSRIPFYPESIHSIVSARNEGTPGPGHDGGAWAARKEFFEAGGIWPHEIISGSALKLMILNGWKKGHPGHPIFDLLKDPDCEALARSYWSHLKKIEPFLNALVCAKRTIHQCHHGSLAGRDAIHARRYSLYKKFCFDPFTDLHTEETGMVRFTGNNPGFERAVAAYLSAWDGLIPWSQVEAIEQENKGILRKAI